jgi:hypothetical protein
MDLYEIVVLFFSLKQFVEDGHIEIIVLQPVLPLLLAVFAGGFGKGKTWCLNRIAGTNCPSGSLVSTRGLSFKSSEIVKSVTFVDTAGVDMPVTVDHPGSHLDKQLIEEIQNKVAYELGHFIIIVVNDLTGSDQD